MGAVGVRQLIVGLVVLWALFLIGAFLAPIVLPDDDPADVVTRQTARVSILFWGIAAGAILLSHRQFGRWAWTLGCLAFLIHVVTAFDRVHGWSNSAAVRHVEEVSGFGPGLFISYAFTALWVADTAWWWIDPRTYDARPAWLDRGIHAFMAFIVFNGTVVYESGFIRWTGLILFALLAVLSQIGCGRERRLCPYCNFIHPPDATSRRVMKYG
jgi:hypothetical protein